MSKTGEDCYFFIHGSCRNGDNCQFRHSRSCLVTQEPCKDWLYGKCSVLLCPKRHPQLSTTPICKFENSPTGCLNRNCSYRHLKAREDAKLPVALAEALKKSVSKPNGEKPTAQPITQIFMPAPAPIQPKKTILEQLQPTKIFIPNITSNSEPKIIMPIFKPKPKIITNIEKPAPIPIINLRSGAQIDAPSYNMNTSSALISNLKVLTTHSEFNASERHNPTQKRPSSYFKPVKTSSHLKSPPSPITFEERPRKLSPITYSSDSKQNSFGIKRTRPLKIGAPVDFSPQEDTYKKLKIKIDSPLVEHPSPVDEAMTSPVLSPLDSTAYFGNSISGSLGCSLSESYNGSQSDDVRIEDQIEDLINANFSPKPSEQEVDLADLQDSDDIFLQFEDLIS